MNSFLQTLLHKTSLNRDWSLHRFSQREMSGCVSDVKLDLSHAKSESLSGPTPCSVSTETNPDLCLPGDPSWTLISLETWCVGITGCAQKAGNSGRVQCRVCMWTRCQGPKNPDKSPLHQFHLPEIVRVTVNINRTGKTSRWHSGLVWAEGDRGVSLYMSRCMFLSACVSVPMSMSAFAYVHVCMCLCVCVPACVYVHACMCLCVLVCVCPCLCMCMCVCVLMCIHVLMCMCAFLCVH